jgi:hypothetical protein
VGAGAHGFDKDQLHRYREAVSDPVAGPALVAAAAASGMEPAGRSTVRPPKGYAASPEAAPFLLFRALFVATTDPAGTASDPHLVDLLERRWTPFVPLHEWLVAHVQGETGD